MTVEPSHEHEDAFRHVMAHRTMLAAYVRAIVYDPDLAEDTLADVSVEIVRSWSQYDVSRPFGPWARGLARRVALANVRKQRGRPVVLDPDVLEAVAGELDAIGDESHLEARKETLRHCMEKLPEFDRQLVQMRYFDRRTYEDISKFVKRTVGALYVAFNRIHKVLRVCVDRNVKSA